MNEIKTGKLPDCLNILDRTKDLETREQFAPQEIEQQKKAYEESIKKADEKIKNENIINSGVGRRYLSQTLDDYVCNKPEQKEVLDKIKAFINNYYSKTLWLLGNSGTGKTMLAAMICRECYGCHYVKSYQIELELEDARSFKAKETKTEIIKKYSEYPILVIDEIAKFESKEEIKYLFMIINERYEQEKTTVLVANQNKKDLIKYLGQPIYDRFVESCSVIEFNFDSYRINKRKELYKD